MRLFVKDNAVYVVSSGQCTFEEAAGSSVIPACPEGAIQLTDEQVELQRTGLYEWVDGEQLLKDTSKTDEEIEALRVTAYADISNGSDKLFIEYQAALAKDSDTSEDKKLAWLARREEIKAEYPFNDQL